MSTDKPPIGLHENNNTGVSQWWTHLINKKCFIQQRRYTDPYFQDSGLSLALSLYLKTKNSHAPPRYLLLIQLTFRQFQYISDNMDLDNIPFLLTRLLYYTTNLNRRNNVGLSNSS